MKVIEKTLLNAQALSGSFTSDWLDISNINDLSVQMSVTTTANTGQFAIEVSNDKAIVDTVTFDPVIPVLADANATITVAMADVPFHWTRIKFTIGTGTNGSVTAKAFGKEI